MTPNVQPDSGSTAPHDRGPSPLVPAPLHHYPGAVVAVDPLGTVCASNGHLDRELGRDLRGVDFALLLDSGSSRRKWELMLATAGPGDTRAWELVLAGTDTLAEPRDFLVVREPEAEWLWLVEQRRDPRLDRLREQVTDVNSALAGTQRELLKERGRLRAALLDLERSNRALDEFAHAVSHDLKVPLRAIRNGLRWIAEDAGDSLDQQTRAQLDRIHTRAERMRALIDGAFAYARAGLDRGSTQLVDSAELVRDVLELIDAPPSIAVHVQPDMPTLTTERIALQQVLLNLVSNAVKYAGHDGRAGRVHVTTRDAGAFWEFSVADDGPGIPPRLHDRIWGLFRTLEPEDETDGTGIGLAVVKRLVEAQGGRVWIESEPGHGATFRFLWPKQTLPRPQGEPTESST